MVPQIFVKIINQNTKHLFFFFRFYKFLWFINIFNLQNVEVWKCGQRHETQRSTMMKRKEADPEGADNNQFNEISTQKPS